MSMSCEFGSRIRAAGDDDPVARVEAHVNEDHPELVGKLSGDHVLAMAEEG